MVIGPLGDRVATSPEHPFGPLHLCLGLQAWPAKFIVVDENRLVTCVPRCEAQGPTQMDTTRSLEFSVPSSSGVSNFYLLLKALR